MNISQDLDECLSLIEASLADSQGVAEYALYIKALIHRQKGAQLAVLFGRARLKRCLPAKGTQAVRNDTGQLSESLQLFQQAAVVSPNNLTYHKQASSR